MSNTCVRTHAHTHVFAFSHMNLSSLLQIEFSITIDTLIIFYLQVYNRLNILMQNIGLCVLVQLLSTWFLCNAHVLLGGGGGGGGAGVFTFGRAVAVIGSMDTLRSTVMPLTEKYLILLNYFHRFFIFS